MHDRVGNTDKETGRQAARGAHHETVGEAANDRPWCHIYPHSLEADAVGCGPRREKSLHRVVADCGESSASPRPPYLSAS